VIAAPSGGSRWLGQPKVNRVELQGQIDLLGADAVRLKIFLDGLANINVPQMISGDAEALLNHMPLQTAQAMIAKALRGDEAGIDAIPPQQLNATPVTNSNHQLHPGTRDHDDPGNKNS
jgi:hypothetical protein